MILWVLGCFLLLSVGSIPDLLLLLDGVQGDIELGYLLPVSGEQREMSAQIFGCQVEVWDLLDLGDSLYWIRDAEMLALGFLLPLGGRSRDTGMAGAAIVNGRACYCQWVLDTEWAHVFK